LVGGVRWLSSHINRNESPIHMMAAMTCSQRISRFNHSWPTEDMAAKIDDFSVSFLGRRHGIKEKQ
jgi:hypothetical protein